MPGQPWQRELFGRPAPPPGRGLPARPAPEEMWLRALRRRGWALPLAVGLCGGLAWLACTWTQPLYQASASVEVQRPPLPVRFAGDPPASAALDATDLQTRAQELGSQQLVAAALGQLPAAESAALPVRRWRRPHWLPPRPVTGAARVAKVMPQLQIVPETSSRLIVLRFCAASPALAAGFLRQLIAADLAQADKRDRAAGRARADFVAAQAAAARARVEAAQAVLEGWTRAHGFADPAAQLAVANAQWQQLAQAQTATAIASVEQGDALAVAAPVAGDPAALADAPTDLEVRRAEAQAEVRRLAAIYRPQAAPLRQAQLQLDSLEASLADLRDQARQQRQRSLAAARQQASDLAAEVARQARSQVALRQAADAFDLAQRNLRADQTVYSGLLDQLQQAVAEAEQVALPLRLAEPATPAPRPLAPNPAQALAYALALGTLLGAATIAGLELWDDGLRLPEAAELGAPLVGWLPPRTAAAEASFRTGVAGVATALLLAQGEASARVVYVTSADAGAGKTTLALALAQVLAEVAPAVLLLDANPQRPALHQAFGGEAAPGGAELLAGRVRVEQALRPTATTGLGYIAAGAPSPQTPVHLAAGAGAGLLAAARARYAWVVVDGGPVFAGPEAGLWAHLADCCLLVAQRGRTSRRHVQRALALLAASSTARCGVVLNRAPEARRATLPAVWLAPPANSAATVTRLRQSA